MGSCASVPLPAEAAAAACQSTVRTVNIPEHSPVKPATAETTPIRAAENDVSDSVRSLELDQGHRGSKADSPEKALHVMTEVRLTGSTFKVNQDPLQLNPCFKACSSQHSPDQPHAVY